MEVGRCALLAPLLVLAISAGVGAEPMTSFNAPPGSPEWGVSEKLLDPEILDAALRQAPPTPGSAFSPEPSSFEELLHSALRRELVRERPGQREELLETQRLLDPEGLEIIHSPQSSRRVLASLRSQDPMLAAEPKLPPPRAPDDAALPEERRHWGIFLALSVLEMAVVTALLWRRRMEENTG